jgi:hypothetical protein
MGGSGRLNFARGVKTQYYLVSIRKSAFTPP